MIRYSINKIATDVKRASHTHQVPHIGLPQIEPVTSARKVNDAPSGALQRNAISATFTRHTRMLTAVPAIDMYTNSDIQALGTWM